MGKPQKAAVLFDLDGTLVDTAPDLARAMNAVLGELGLPAASREDVRRLTGRGARALITRGVALVAPGLDIDADAAVARFLVHYARDIAVDSTPFPGAQDALQRFRDQGWAIAVCTNKPEALARALLDALDLSSLIDALVGGDTAERPKPDPAPVRLAIERLGGAERAFFVGDSAVDIDAARAAGLGVGLVAHGYEESPVESLGADVVLGTLADAPAAAERFAKPLSD